MKNKIQTTDDQKAIIQGIQNNIAAQQSLLNQFLLGILTSTKGVKKEDVYNLDNNFDLVKQEKI